MCNTKKVTCDFTVDSWLKGEERKQNALDAQKNTDTFINFMLELMPELQSHRVVIIDCSRSKVNEGISWMYIIINKSKSNPCGILFRDLHT